METNPYFDMVYTADQAYVAMAFLLALFFWLGWKAWKNSVKMFFWFLRGSIGVFSATMVYFWWIL